MTLVVINTECSNLGSLIRILKRIGTYDIDIMDSMDETRIKQASCIVIPGVSSFDSTINSLKERRFYDYLKSPKNIAAQTVVGLCAGAQIFFESSEEGKQEGLGHFKGVVKKIPISQDYSSIHLGWNTIRSNKGHPQHALMDHIKTDEEFYFCHSYRFPDTPNALAYTNYGEEFPVIVTNGKTVSIQFHPEKSYTQGMQLLTNVIAGQ